MESKNGMLIFRVICIVSTLIIIGYCIHVYCLDDDLCTVDFHQYLGHEDDKYPILSLCFKNHFNLPYLLENGVNESGYLAFLNGEYFESKLLDIDFEKATLNFSEHILDDYVKWTNGSGQHSTVQNKAAFENTFNGFWRDGFYKCYGINAPFQGEYLFTGVLLDGKVFPTTTNQSIRPSEGNYMISIFHYPTQLLQSIQNIKYIWPAQKGNKNFLMSFQVDGVEMLTRRQKKKSPCNGHWEHYDEMVLQRHIEKIGCRAPYQLSNTTMPVCTSKEKIMEAKLPPLTPDIKRKHPLPCKTMEKIFYTFHEEDIADDWEGEGKFAVNVYIFDQNFKEIKQNRYII